MKSRLIALAAVFLLVASTAAQAQTLTLAWDRNLEPDVTGYIVEFGTSSRHYTHKVDAGNVTSYRVQGLPPDVTYYFAVRAYTSAGLIGSLSNEVMAKTTGHARGADFNKDGETDILWQNFKNGGVWLWRMRGVSAIGGAPLGPGWIPDTKWRIVGAADINRDGDTDVVWQHDGGHLSVWYMRGETMLLGQVITETPVPAGSRVVATGDLNNDDRSDLIFQQSDGTVFVRYMDGAIMRSEEVIVEPADTIWKVAAAADFDRDGWLDILWRNSDTGELAIWFMKDRELLSARMVNLSLSDQNWHVAGIADFNADGRPDIIWRHYWNGGLATWLMNGATVVGGHLLNPYAMDNDWFLAGPR